MPRDDARMPRLDNRMFAREWLVLYGNFPPAGQTPEERAALMAGWWRVLGKQDWLTVDIFERAVEWTLEHVKDYRPTVGKFLEVCEMVERTQRTEEAKRQLPAPDDGRGPCPPELVPQMRRYAGWLGLPRGWDGGDDEPQSSEADA